VPRINQFMLTCHVKYGSLHERTFDPQSRSLYEAAFARAQGFFCRRLILSLSVKLPVPVRDYMTIDASN